MRCLVLQPKVKWLQDTVFINIAAQNVYIVLLLNVFPKTLPLFILIDFFLIYWSVVLF